MSTQSLLPVVALRSPDVALQWHEAVAVVAELAASLAHLGPHARMPDASHLFLSTDGAIVDALTGGSAEPAVPGLGRLLDWLTEGMAVPAELTSLVEKSIAEPPGFESVTGFAGALAFFERPGRQAVLAALAARASEVAAQGDMHAELERLKVKARQSAARSPVKPDAAQPRWWRRPVVAKLVLVGAVAAISVGTVALVVLFWPVYGSVSAPADLADRAQAQVSRLVESGLRALTAVRPAPSEPPAPAAGAPAPAPARAARPATREAVAESPDVGEVVADPVPAAEQWSVALEPADQQEAQDPAPDGRVYTAADPGIAPPELVRQQLPTDPPVGLTLGEVGVLEILVSETGEVERARLVSRESRFQERMIVAAAKTWKFTPASKDGRPVKYRTRVRITL